MPKKIKARRGYMDTHGFIWKKQVSRHHKPVAVIEVDDPDALVEQVASALNAPNIEGESRSNYTWITADARRVLESLGILTKPTTKRKGGKA